MNFTYAYTCGTITTINKQTQYHLQKKKEKLFHVDFWPWFWFLKPTLSQRTCVFKH